MIFDEVGVNRLPYSLFKCCLCWYNNKIINKNTVSINELENISNGFIMLDFLSELFQYMRQRKKYWLVPLILVLVILGGILVLAQGSAVAPFIYTLF